MVGESDFFFNLIILCITESVSSLIISLQFIHVGNDPKETVTVRVNKGHAADRAV